MRRLAALLAVGLVTAPLAAQRPADHVIFVTLDGVRPEDFFGGADSLILFDRKASGISDTALTRARFWRGSVAERRRALMPFLWDSLVPKGVLVGALDGAPTTITNGLKFSAPGYQELFTGKAQPDVTTNDDRRYAHRTIFDVVRDRLASRRTDVAAFTSWAVQGRLVSNRPEAVVVSASFEPLPIEARVGAGLVIEPLQRRIVYPDVAMRFDGFTHALALDYLRRYHPRLLHIGHGETDEDAHARRYDHYLAALNTADAMLRELWQAVQADPILRGRTALVVSTDHGRGRTPADWTSHGKEIDGAEHIWIFAVGAGIASRGLVTSAPTTQSQVGPTILALLGLDPRELAADAAPAAPHFLATLRPGRQ
jgi:hypothetical protein